MQQEIQRTGILVPVCTGTAYAEISDVKILNWDVGDTESTVL